MAEADSLFLSYYPSTPAPLKDDSPRFSLFHSSLFFVDSISTRDTLHEGTFKINHTLSKLSKVNVLAVQLDSNEQTIRFRRELILPFTNFIATIVLYLDVTQPKRSKSTNTVRGYIAWSITLALNKTKLASVTEKLTAAMLDGFWIWEQKICELSLYRYF